VFLGVFRVYKGVFVAICNKKRQPKLPLFILCNCDHDLKIE